MTRTSWLAAAAFAALTAACVHHDNADTSSLRAPAASVPDRTEAAPPADTTSSAQAESTPAPPTQTAPTPAPTPGSYTDAQLRAFIAASAEIDPLNRQLATASAEQRTALATHIRGILQRNNLDGATYNAIAAQSQTDTALAARINGLRSPS
jgi:hypothetical protein